MGVKIPPVSVETDVCAVMEVVRGSRGEEDSELELHWFGKD